VELYHNDKKIEWNEQNVYDQYHADVALSASDILYIWISDMEDCQGDDGAWRLLNSVFCIEATEDGATTTTTTTTTTATSTVTDQFLFLSQSRILSLPSFKEVDCQQEFPTSLRLDRASAGIVMDNNLMVCGGRGMSTCRRWTEDGWEETTTGFHRDYAAASSVDGSLIITGGYDPTNPRYLASTMIYTEDAGWEDFTPLPSPTRTHCQVSVGDTVYIVGGYTNSGTTGDTYKLSMATKQWVKQSSLNTPRYNHGCAAWDGGVIVVGGWDDGRLSSAGRVVLSSVEKYNPVSNKWFTVTPLPTPLYRMQALVWDNDLYVLGGHTGKEYNKKVFKLKHDEDAWEELEVALQNTDRRSVFPAVTLSSLHCN